MSKYDQPWAPDAACLHLDPEAWALPDETTSMTDDNRWAIRICHGCPVIRDCARYALRVWPTGMIHAATPIRRSQSDTQRSAISVAQLNAIIGDAA